MNDLKPHEGDNTFQSLMGARVVDKEQEINRLMEENISMKVENFNIYLKIKLFRLFGGKQ